MLGYDVRDSYLAWEPTAGHPLTMASRTLSLLLCISLLACSEPPAAIAPLPDAETAPDDTTPPAPDTQPPPEDIQPLPDTSPSGPWRSTLFPNDWTPDHTDPRGRFLHDFSYAGYHNSERPPEIPTDALHVDVVSAHGADPTGSADATAAIQAAIDEVSASGGGVVSFPAGLFRLESRSPRGCRR